MNNYTPIVQDSHPMSPRSSPRERNSKATTSSPRTPSSTPSPRTPKGVLQDIFEEFRLALNEYEEFKAVKKLLISRALKIDLDDDLKGILGMPGSQQHAFGKGACFRMAKAVIQLKQKEPDHFKSWIQSSENDILNHAKKEFDSDVQLMKLALKALLRSSHAKGDLSNSLKKEYDEIMDSLSTSKRSQIDFKKITDLMSHNLKEKHSFFGRLSEEGRDKSPARSESSPLVGTAVESTSKSPKTLRRKYSQKKVPRFIHNKDKLTSDEEVSPKSSDPRPRASSSPHKSSLLDKNTKVTFSPEAQILKKNSKSIVAIQQVLTGGDFDLVEVDDGNYQCLEGNFTESTISLIIGEIRRISVNERTREIQQKLQSLLKSFYDHQVAREIFKSRKEIYSQYLKLYIEVELMPYQLNEEQFKKDNATFRQWLEDYSVPDSLQVNTSYSNFVTVKDIFSKKEEELVLCDIQFLSDPLQAYQLTIKDLGNKLKDAKVSLKSQLDKIGDCKWLRELFIDESKADKEDYNFLLNLGFSNKFKEYLEDLKKTTEESGYQKVNLCRLIRGIGELNDRLATMIACRSFPNPSILIKTVESHILRFQHHFLSIDRALAVILEYFSTQEEMSVWLSQKNLKGTIRIEELKALFETPQYSLAAFINCFNE